MPFDFTPQTDTDLDETGRVLMRAAEEVEKGWCQCALEWDGGVCVMAAIQIATGAPRNGTGIGILKFGWTDLAREANHRLEQYTGTSSMNFNNAPERTAAEVIAALRAAAYMKNT